MNLRRSAAVLVLTGVMAMTAPATAQTGSDGALGPAYVRASAADLGAGTFPGSGLPAVAPAVVSPFAWERTPTGGRCVVFPGPVPAALARMVTPLPGIAVFPYFQAQIGTLQDAPPGALRVDGAPVLPPGAVDAGEFVVDTATRRDGPPEQRVVPRCARPGAPLPAEPPTAAEIWRQTPLPRASVQASPPGTRDWPGIVNLESRFWAGALPDAQATVTLDGYVVDVRAHPVAYGWALDDGTTRVRTDPGRADAATTTTFRRRGDHEVDLYVVWAGVAHIAAPALGLDFGVHDLGTVTLPETAVHHVAEIRALLRSRAARG
jgi:hypothetical protein